MKATSLRNKIVLLTITICALVPLLMFASVGTLYYKLGIESLFDTNVKRVINDTVTIAENYVDEHKETITKDINFMSTFIENNYAYLAQEPAAFNNTLEEFLRNINISGAVIFDKYGNIIGRSQNSLSILFNLFNENEFLLADQGKAIIKEMPNNKIRAMVRLERFLNPTYLLVERNLDSQIISHLNRTKGSQNYYQYLRNNIEKEQAKLALMFIIVSILIFIVAIYVSRKIAHIITNPINDLVTATKEIMKGDYSVRIPEKDAKDETMVLTKAFNKMIKDIAKKTTALENANNIIDERRKFIETVLAEISASIIVVDNKNKVILFNNSAKNLFKNIAHNTNISKELPEVFEYLSVIKKTPQTILKQKLSIVRENKKIELLLAISAEILDSKVISYIISLDDITQLVAAQKNAAWVDVAKRIAHEIKNPLTPIQLSADRLSRKFSKQITEDLPTFNNLLSTINSHITQIRTIIEEFVSFARLPNPKFQEYDIVKIINNSVFAQQTSYPAIKITFESEFDSLNLECDKMQMSQVLNNIIKNAAEALEEVKKKTQSIAISVKTEDELCIITCLDNGKGFPTDMLDNITDPYVTTKQKGMGLGLAISKKIIEDHKGILKLYNAPKKGGCVEIMLPYTTK